MKKNWDRKSRVRLLLILSVGQEQLIFARCSKSPFVISSLLFWAAFGEYVGSHHRSLCEFMLHGFPSWSNGNLNYSFPKIINILFRPRSGSDDFFISHFVFILPSIHSKFDVKSEAIGKISQRWLIDDWIQFSICNIPISSRFPSLLLI